MRDVVDVMVTEAGLAVPELSADGGASANDLLMQLQADQLGVPVRRPVVTETTALGAAFLAGLGTGVWASTGELAQTWALDRRFEPENGRRDDGRHDRWRAALPRARRGPAEGLFAWAGKVPLRRRGRPLLVADVVAPNSRPFSAAMSFFSSGTRLVEICSVRLLRDRAGEHLAQRRHPPRPTRHEHPPPAGCEVLHQRLRAPPRPTCRRQRPRELLRLSAKAGSAASVSRTRSVSIQVGWAEATVTPRCATSSRSASPNRSSPAFEAQ